MMKPLVLAFAVLAMASELHSIGAHDLNVTSSTPLEHKHLRSNVVLTREPVPLQGLRGANALGTKKKEAAESLRRWLADKNNEAHPPPSNERSLKEKDKGKKEKVDKKPFVVELVKDISTYDGAPAELTELTSGLWVFRADKYYSDPHNDHFAHLYKTDGTEAGTEDITPDAAGENKRDSDNFFWLTLYNGKVYFVYYYITADPPYTHKYQLWRTDGLNAEMVEDFGDGSKVWEGSYKEEGMVVSNNKLFLPVGIQGETRLENELWGFEEQPDGTVIKTTVPDSKGVVLSTVTAGPNDLFFVACSQRGMHCQLKKTNGTDTKELTGDIFDHDVINNHRWYPQMVMLKGNLYFAANHTTTNDPSESSGYLGKSNGTPGGTFMVTNKVGLAPRISLLNDRLYFPGTDGQLWFSDGTDGGTRRATDTLKIAGIVNWCNGNLFLGNRNTSCYHADDLWISDGKEGGKSEMVCQCCLSQSYPSAVWDNKLFFITDFNDKHRLKQVDGSKKGPPTLVTNEQNPQGWNNIRFIWTVESEDKLFFSGYGLNGTEDPVGKELWVIHY